MKKINAMMLMGFGVVMAAAGAVPATIEFTRGDGTKVTVTALTDNIIRVAPEGAGESRIALEPSGEFTGTVSATAIETSTGVTVSVDPATGVLTIDGGKGRVVTDGGARWRDGSGRRRLALGLPGRPGHVYGGGERGYSFNLYGDTLEVYNTQNYGYTEGDPRIRRMNISMPLLVYPDGYAVLFDDIAAAEMVPGDSILYATEAPHEPAYYYVNSPAGFAGLPGELTSLTGRQELPPFWSLAYITSKYGYRTEAEARGVIDSLKTAGYPVDGMVLDLYWYGKEEDMGRLAWDPEQWPSYRSMLSDMKKIGVNMVAISQPFVLKNGRGLDNFRKLDEARMFGRDSLGNTREVTIWVGEGGMLDVSNPDTRAWLRARYKALTDSGMTGWWGDLGEPEAHPSDMVHANGLTARQYHNYYGNDWSSLIHGLFAEEYPERRLMALMRGGTTGLQRYSVFPWSTDVSRSWGGLQPQVKIMLNSGLSGLGYMSHDVGGFAVDKERPVDAELYVRWLQLGLFSPVLRTHSTVKAEPYHYPELQGILLPLVKARYQWLPYNYTLAWENTTCGTPLVRPVGMYEADPAASDTITDQYLWGRDVMVAPVLREGVTSREVYFPSSDSEWIAYDNASERYKGGSRAEVEAPLGRLPLFVRAGALLPRADYPMENVGDYDPSRYTIDYFPGSGTGESSYSIFEDDRESRSSLPSNRYAMIEVSADNQAKYLTLTAMQYGAWDGMPTERELTFVVHGLKKAPKSVTANGMSLTPEYDAAKGELRIAVARQALPLSVIVDK